MLHVGQASKSLQQIETSLSALEFGKPSKVTQKGNGARSSSSVRSDYAEMSELEDSLKLIVRKNSRVVPPLPLHGNVNGNVNGAKAQESDYACIEDLRIHLRASPMAANSDIGARERTFRDMKQPSVSASRVPPPVPKRTEKVEKSSSAAQVSNEGPTNLPIQKMPLPPRPTELINGATTPNEEIEPSPPPLPPPFGTTSYYNGAMLPSPQPKPYQTRDSQTEQSIDPLALYDTPRSVLQGNSGDFYNIPRPSMPQAPTDRARELNLLYDVPRSVRQQMTASSDLYKVPGPSSGGASLLDTYDVPPYHHHHQQPPLPSDLSDLYSIPRTTRQTSGMCMYMYVHVCIVCVY